MQDDLLFSALTVWETVRTAAMLRLPSTTSKAQKLELAEAVIQELGERYVLRGTGRQGETGVS